MFARDGPELLVVVVARELDQVLLAADVDLRSDGFDVVGLLDRFEHTNPPRDP